MQQQQQQLFISDMVVERSAAGLAKIFPGHDRLLVCTRISQCEEEALAREVVEHLSSDGELAAR